MDIPLGRREVLSAAVSAAVLPVVPGRTRKRAWRRSGAYVGWPQTIDELSRYGTLRGRAVEVVGEYLDGRDWASIEGHQYFFDVYASSGRARGYGRKLVLSVPLLPDPLGVDPGATLAAGAAGGHDDHFATLGRRLVDNGLGAIVVRLGWEANSPGNYPWSAVPDPAAYRGAFACAARAMRAVAPDLRFDWSSTVAVDGHAFDARDAYPGDDVVDVVGLDVYDMRSVPMSDADRWRWYRTAPGGLDEMAAFARSRGKQVGVPEWAVASTSWGGGGDSPTFIANMHAWMDEVRVAYEIYNEVRYPWTDGRLFTGPANPAAAREYRGLVRRP